MTNWDSILKSRDITLSTKVHLVKAMAFPVVMYGCESLTIKKAEHRRVYCFWAVVLEKTLERPLDCKEIQPVHAKYQSWVFIGRTDAEAETPILWRPDVKGWHIWKDPDAGKDWRWEEKGMTEDEMVGWHLFSDLLRDLPKITQLVQDKIRSVATEPTLITAVSSAGKLPQSFSSHSKALLLMTDFPNSQGQTIFKLR